MQKKVERYSYEQRYEQWLTFPDLISELKQQLVDLQHNPKEQEERFHTDLAFGTGGLRGIIGAGTNRMNTYTVRKASLGLGYYLKQTYGDEPINVVIAYDCRHKSAEFAEQAALTLNTLDIKVYLFPELRPTPQLSFAVRKLQAQAGIVITASHNPPEYNGYKVYGADGAQINLETADQIISQISSIENELEIPVLEKAAAIEQNKLRYLDAQMDKEYIDYVVSLSVQPNVIKQVAEDYRIVFTPLHGTALYPVTQVLEHAGFKHVYVVKEQETADAEFSTVKSPNPEEPEAFAWAIQYAKKYEANLIMGTDPDADRMGVVVPDGKGEYKALTGNQTGALLLHYLLEQKKRNGTLSSQHTICKTIVTSEIGRFLGQAYGIETIDTLTGFKFIGEKIKQFEETGERQFLFGYEESYGYLIGAEARDKDAIQAVLLVAEMGAYYQTRGMSLLDALDQLYKQYGYFKEKLISITMKGLDGLTQIQEKIRRLRDTPPQEIAGIAVKWVEDYQTGIRTNLSSNETEQLTLPASNVIKYIMDDDSWVCVRPSGTEPKLKLYIGVQDSTERAAEEKLEQISAYVGQKWLAE